MCKLALNRINKAKYHRVKEILRDPYNGGKSNRELSRRTGINHAVIERYRRLYYSLEENDYPHHALKPGKKEIKIRARTLLKDCGCTRPSD